MTQQSVERRDSTRSLKATPKNIADAASWLMLDEPQAETFRRCLEGEPLARMLGVVQWLADHERDSSYDPSVMLVGWAKSRGAGCFRTPEPTPAERTQIGSSDAQYAEIERSLPRSGWGVRFSNEQVQRNLDRMGG